MGDDEETARKTSQAGVSPRPLRRWSSVAAVFHGLGKIGGGDDERLKGRSEIPGNQMSILTSLTGTAPTAKLAISSTPECDLGRLLQTVAKGGDLKRRAGLFLASHFLFLPASGKGPIHAQHIPAQLHDTKTRQEWWTKFTSAT
jgi:hypothetical protein